MPYYIFADRNNEPTAMTAWFGVDKHYILLGEGCDITCTAGSKAGSRFDCVIMHKTGRPFVETLDTIYTVTWGPHFGLRMKFVTDPKVAKVRTLRAVKLPKLPPAPKRSGRAGAMMLAATEARSLEPVICRAAMEAEQDEVHDSGKLKHWDKVVKIADAMEA